MSIIAQRCRLNHQSNPPSFIHQYWRVFITAYGGGSNILVQSTSGWRPSPGGTNYDQHNAFASSFASGQFASNAWSSNSSVAWQSADTSLPAWVAIDLGSPLLVEQFAYQGPALAFTDRAATAFTIDYSDDGTTWTNIPGSGGSGLTWGDSELKLFSVG